MQPHKQNPWIIVVVGFVITFIGFGSAYSFSAFFEPLQKEFSASRGSVSLIFSLAGFLYFGFGLVSGFLADRFGARPLIITGMVLLSAGLVLAGFAQSLMQVYIAYGIGVGLGLGCAYVPMLAAVQRAFVARRGLASGLAVSGIGVGTLIFPPVTSFLVNTIGWREAYWSLGLLSAVLGISASFLICTKRKKMENDTGYAENRLVSILRSRDFIRLYTACLLCGLGAFIPFVHLVPYAKDHGINATNASLLITLIGIGSTAGRFMLGNLADRFGRQSFLVLNHAVMALVTIIWAFSSAYFSLMLFALLYGVFYGAWVAVLPSAVADRFGGKHLSTIIGVLYTSVALGTLIGPSLAGDFFDKTGGYSVSIIGMIIVNLLAAVIAFHNVKKKA